MYILVWFPDPSCLGTKLCISVVEHYFADTMKGDPFLWTMQTLIAEVNHKFTLATTYLQSAVQTFETLGLPDVFPTGVLFAVCLPATPTPTTVPLRENATCLDPVPWRADPRSGHAMQL